MNAEEILDELHQIREELMEKYRDQPDEVFIREIEARAAKVYQELGLEPADSPSGSDWPRATVPEAKEG